MEKRFTEKWKLIVDIAIFVLVVYLDAINVLPISQTIYLAPLIFLILRVRKETFASIGWGFGGANVYKQIALGVLIGVLMELFAIFVLSPMINGYFGTNTPQEEPNLVILTILLPVIGIHVLQPCLLPGVLASKPYNRSALGNQKFKMSLTALDKQKTMGDLKTPFYIQ